MYDITLKVEAIRLRVEERLSLPEIVSLTGVTKSTLSIWLRSHPLPKEDLHLRRKANAVNTNLKSNPHKSSLAKPLRPLLSKSDLGEACRQLICAKLMLRGYQVFRPLNEDTPIDLLVMTSKGHFLKCQCKCIYRGLNQTYHTMRLVSVRKWGPSSKAVMRKYLPEEVDFFLGYCVDNDSVYIIPYADTAGRTKLTLRVNRVKFSELEQDKWLGNFDLLKNFDGTSSNGRTADFESANIGSIPIVPTPGSSNG